MARRKPFTAILFTAALAACSGGAAPPTAAPGQTSPAAATANSGGQPTPTPAAATGTPPAATGTPPATAPAGGGGTAISVTLTGGGHPGTYTASANPNCSFGFIGKDVWGVNYTDAAAGDADISTLVVSISPADSGGSTLSVVVTIGSPGTASSENYTILGAAVSPSGPTASVDDKGATAVVHAAGTTLTGSATLDVTVNCPSVTRA